MHRRKERLTGPIICHHDIDDKSKANMDTEKNPVYSIYTPLPFLPKESNKILIQKVKHKSPCSIFYRDHRYVPRTSHHTP